MSIDSRDELENASDLIEVNFHRNSKNIRLIAMQSDKYLVARTAIESGIRRGKECHIIGPKCRLFSVALPSTTIHRM
jgi:hypothetical protein